MVPVREGDAFLGHPEPCSHSSFCRGSDFGASIMWLGAAPLWVSREKSVKV